MIYCSEIIKFEQILQWILHYWLIFYIDLLSHWPKKQQHESIKANKAFFEIWSHCDASFVKYRAKTNVPPKKKHNFLPLSFWSLTHWPQKQKRSSTQADLSLYVMISQIHNIFLHFWRLRTWDFTQWPQNKGFLYSSKPTIL